MKHRTNREAHDLSLAILLQGAGQAAAVLETRCNKVLRIRASRADSEELVLAEVAKRLP